jgi:hypothetical protein
VRAEGRQSGSTHHTATLHSQTSTFHLLQGIYQHISDLEHRVKKAFPNARFGSNRDQYAYKRVDPPLRVGAGAYTCSVKPQPGSLQQWKEHGSFLYLLRYGLVAVAGCSVGERWPAILKPL